MIIASDVFDSKYFTVLWQIFSVIGGEHQIFNLFFGLTDIFC